MIRFSLVIQNQKNEFFICECPSPDIETRRFEFLGGEIETDTLPPFGWFIQKIIDIVDEKVAVVIDDIQKYEMYWRDEPLWVHAIFTATIKSRNPQKKYYRKLLWLPINKIDIDTLNTYGLQVYRKIDECSYCRYIRDRQGELDEFFNTYFSKEEENLAILETLEAANEESPVYMLAFKQELIHLRASLIENAKLKNNITVQNYFRLYGRDDLAEKIDTLLQIEVRTNLSLRDMIKESVDKHIAHYDKPSDTSEDIYNYCKSIFSANGKLPLKKFITFIDGYIMGLISEMWYDAGELGVSMSDRCPEQRQIIIDHGNSFATELIQALKI
ncbi:hypothetical protein [Dehalobacterium formicoaceticum]|uniref:hypothetical protein n=1 Tax=Dehalobacterium formicoaceticum TaxID=51515 RepID=UPI0031F69C6D